MRRPPEHHGAVPEVPTTVDPRPGEDPRIVAELRQGKAAAVKTLVERDYAVSALLANLTSRDSSAALEAAWRGHIRDVASGSLREGLRRGLLRTIWEARDAEEPEQTESAVLGTFAPPGDRWEGWWDKEPPPWPEGFTPQPEQVAAALGRLPLQLRAVLVLRDVGGLSPEDSAAALDNDHLDQPELLQRARDAYLIELDRELSSHEPGQ